MLINNGAQLEENHFKGSPDSVVAGDESRVFRMEEVLAVAFGEEAKAMCERAALNGDGGGGDGDSGGDGWRSWFPWLKLR